MAAQGYSIYRNLDTNATGALVAAGQHVLGGYYIYNNAASARFVKLYDKATAPTVGTDVPIMTIPLPASAAANLMIAGRGAGDVGIPFRQGIGIAATNLIADSDTTAPTTNDVVVNLLYI